jgi:hypothetical protein
VNVSEHDQRGKKETYLVIEAALLQRAANLHVLGLGGTSMLTSTRRPGENLTLPLDANIHSTGFTEAGVVVLNESASALKQRLNNNFDQVFEEHTLEYVQKKSLGSSPSTAGYEQKIGSDVSSFWTTGKPN